MTSLIFPFLLCLALLLFHEFALNLSQRISFTDNIYYQTWRAFPAGIKIYAYVMGIYVILRCITLRHGDFFKGFAAGANLFSVVLFMTGGVVYRGLGRPEFSFIGEVITINEMAAFFLQFLFMNLLAYKSSHRRIYKLFYAIFSVVCLFVIFISQSRTSTGALLISFTLAMLIKKPKTTLTIIFAGLMILAVTLTNENDLNDLTAFLPRRYTAQRISSSISLGATNRTLIWHDYLTNMSDRMLITGEGLGGYVNVLYQRPLTFYRFRRAGNDAVSQHYTHNSYISILLDTGAFGLILYCLLLIKISLELLSALIRKKIYWPYFSMYISLLIWGFFEGTLLNYMFVLFTPIALSEIYRIKRVKPEIFTVQSFLSSLAQHKNLILRLTVGAFLISLAYCSFTGGIYKAECVISVSENNIDFKMNFIDEVLRSDYIVGLTVDKFGLMRVYGKNSRSEAINYFRENALHAVSSESGSIGNIAVLDRDPERAAAILDFVIPSMIRRIQEIKAAEISLRAEIYDAEIARLETKLFEAENEFALYQKENNILQVRRQVRDIISQTASLRENIITREVELSAMKNFSSVSNVRLRLSEARLGALRSELENLSYAGNTPAAVVGYRRRMRDLVVAEKSYLDAMNRLERLKMNPDKNFPVVKFIEPVTIPEQRFKPYTAAVLVTATFSGLLLAFVIIMLKLCSLDKN